LSSIISAWNGEFLAGAYQKSITMGSRADTVLEKGASFTEKILKIEVLENEISGIY